MLKVNSVRSKIDQINRKLEVILPKNAFHIFTDGFSYEREALEEWFDRGKYTSPMTNLEISPDVLENSILRERIGNFLRDMDFDGFTFEQNEEI